MNQIMYINERIKDIEDIQNGITVENLVLYDKLRIFSCINVQSNLIFNGHHWNKLKFTTLENVALATRRQLIGKHNSCLILQQCFVCDLRMK
jgi:hypothetical protein